jgi:outer membrane lipoprotein-sorting protein
MADLREQESEFMRLLQRLAFDDTVRPEHAGNLRDRVLARFDQAQAAEPARPWWKRVLTQGRDIMRRPIPRLIAASAACLAVAFWLLVPGRQSTAQAFNHFALAVVEAKTAKFQMEVLVEGQPKQTAKTWYLAPGKFRQELGMLTNISDLPAGKMLTLIPGEKKAMMMNIKGVPKDKASDNYFERLRQLLAEKRDAKDDQFERLGEKEIDGKRALGFRNDSPAGTVTLWGDPKTGQPIRIESVWSGVPRTQVVMSNFEINVELKADLFDQTVPANYKLQSFDVDGSQSREQDLVQAFRSCADIGGGEFPETLDTAGLNKLIIKYAIARRQANDFSDEKMQELMKQSIQIGRGFQFALMLPESADATYAGKGVKRDQKDRPIFWYKPEGSPKYRVLYANLTLQDADTAPQVAGAIRLEKAGKAKAAN